MKLLKLLLERVGRPGLIGPAGVACEKRCERQMRGYFNKLHDDILALKLEELVASGASAEIAGHTAEIRVHNVLRNNRTLLLHILITNIYHTAMVADKTNIMAEAEPGQAKVVKNELSKLDKLGLSGQEAATYAAKYAAGLVSGIDRTTQKIIAGIIRDSVTDMLGVPGTARQLRLTLDNMTKSRATLIARTEMNQTWSWAALEKMHRDGVEYKQLIVHPDELLCDICSSIADAGPVPVDDPFVDDEGEEYDSSPIHPNCRCATTGAPPPAEED